MKFVIEIWQLGKLLELLNESGRVNLNPEYQRNAIWSLQVQRHLVNTILSGMPIPAFFLRKLSGSRFEMVDGQQRSRAIKNFFNNIEVRSGSGVGEFFKELKKEEQLAFLNYSVSIVMLDETVSDVQVRDFYVLVNSSGLKLNKAELRKAEYHSTKLLALCSELSNKPIFTKLKLFTLKSSDRMNDIDFLSELLTYLLEGITDKKKTVDSVYKGDIDETQVAVLRDQFLQIIDVISKLDDIVPLAETRLAQKADFYTLFGFIHENTALAFENIQKMYELIIKLDDEISPSQEDCVPLREYALACVSQSNSKAAREKRSEFFTCMFLNKEIEPTRDQLDVASFIRGNIIRANGYTLVEAVR
jgi:hypothetical protein